MFFTELQKIINLETEIGEIVLYVNRPDSMHIESNPDKYLTVRGLKYKLSLHLSLDGGLWREKLAKDERELPLP